MPKFFETFNNILIWFRDYCQERFRDRNMDFKEIDNTINVLNKKIKKYDDSIGVLEDNLQHEHIDELDLSSPELCGLVRQSIEESKNARIEAQRAREEAQRAREEAEKARQELERQSEKQDEMSQKQEEHIELTKDISNDVKEFRKEFKEFRKEFKEFHEEYKLNQEKVAKKLDTIPSEEELDKLMWKFTKKQVTIIENCVKKTIAKEDLEKQEQRLINSLKQENWDKLEEDSKTFLTSSIITYHNIHDYEDDIDYSGVCLLVTKALEVELCKRFYKGFSSYLNKKYKKDFSKYHTAMVGNYFKKDSKNYRLKKPRDCNLGRITHIFCYAKDDRIKDEEIHQNNLDTIIEYSKLTYFKDLSYDEIKNKLYTYGEYVDNIRKDYRNPAAHIGNLDKTSAKECFNYVLKVDKVLREMLKSFDE